MIVADLSATAIITEMNCFPECFALQTVSLPKTLERISQLAFYECGSLVTVTVAVTVTMPLLHSQPIHIGDSSFVHCDSLANLVIPKGSIFDPDAFYPFGGCTLFEDRFGKDSESIIAGLMSRFDDFPLHKRCYDHSSTTAQELLLLLIEDQGAMEASSLVDDFGMTPLHVFFSSTIDPRQDLLQVLLEKLPCCILDLKDANDKRPLDYLMANWTEENKILLQMTLQKWMLDPFDRWGIASWKKGMNSRMQAILAETEMDQTAALCTEAYAAFVRYEAMEATSILEMTLWKGKLTSGWSNHDTTKRQALDRDSCRVVCGSDVVLPRIVQFLDIPMGSSA